MPPPTSCLLVVVGTLFRQSSSAANCLCLLMLLPHFVGLSRLWCCVTRAVCLQKKERYETPPASSFALFLFFFPST
ncbi:hypothetical protein DFJ73DRAFT_849751 [Zopfochytrium polystomum]|nr:hypothetical protein DFJ73DRAFT_849751 [Zopfochytrium polystomum]